MHGTLLTMTPYYLYHYHPIQTADSMANTINENPLRVSERSIKKCYVLEIKCAIKKWRFRGKNTKKNSFYLYTGLRLDSMQNTPLICMIRTL